MENNTHRQHLIQLIFLNTMKLILAGAIIGIFHQYDLWVAVFLSVYLVYILSKKFYQNDKEKWIYLIGILLTGICGVICESWGIYNQYWSYHNLENNRDFPYWLPIAWGLAFSFIYRLEKEIILIKNIQSHFKKVMLALFISMIFPTIGEIVVINLGAWSYHWPLQFLGVPLLAILLLMVFHTGVNLLLMFICRQLNISNVVFTPR